MKDNEEKDGQTVDGKLNQTVDGQEWNGVSRKTKDSDAGEHTRWFMSLDKQTGYERCKRHQYRGEEPDDEQDPRDEELKSWLNPK